ncbi:MAG TPA: ATP-grasp domain-containing protein [Bryobacteraceae bacterium]
MRIGITYDLRAEYLNQGYGEEETAEFDSVETIDAIDDVLGRLGHKTDRIGNIQSLTKRLAADERWDLVFNIAEGMHGFGREAQVPALLDAFAIPYTFSDALVLALALHKGFTKRLVRSFGIPTPDFAIVDAASDLGGVNVPWPVIVKPVAGGTGAGISEASKAENPKELARACGSLLEKFRQPVLIETFLPGREFTVGVVGTGPQARVLGVMEIVFHDMSHNRGEPKIYSYANKRDYLTRVSYCLADEETTRCAADIALRVWNELGCRDAGRIDLRCDVHGNLNFLEINPLAGLHPVDSDLVILCRLVGIDHASLIETILASAQERVISGARKRSA